VPVCVKPGLLSDSRGATNAAIIDLVLGGGRVLRIPQRFVFTEL
jgi:hypothetical protein